METMIIPNFGLESLFYQIFQCLLHSEKKVPPPGVADYNEY